MSKWYSDEEKQIIEKVKEYLKCIRTLKQERLSLKYEYDDIPLPQSPNVGDEMSGSSISSKDHQLNSRIMRRELLLKRIEMFDEVIDRFTYTLYLLKGGQRTIINCFVDSRGYSDMIQKLEEMYFINERAYSRNINDICLELSKYIDYENPPRIEDLNRKFNEYMKSISY